MPIVTITFRVCYGVSNFAILIKCNNYKNNYLFTKKEISYGHKSKFMFIINVCPYNKNISSKDKKIYV